MSLYLTTPKEFSFDECLIFLNRSSNECLHFVEDTRVRKLLRVDNNLILFEVSKTKSKLKIDILNTESSKTLNKHIHEYVTEWFDLNINIQPFYSSISKDILLKDLVEKYYGLRLIGIPELFEALCWAIIGQQINLTFAYTLKRRFVETIGEKLKFEEKDYWLFPSAEQLLNITVSDLMKLQFTGKKSEYILDLAQKINLGELPNKQQLKKLGYEEAKSTLLKIRGVGEWTADYVLMKCLRFQEAIPIGDVGLHNAIKNILNLQNKPSFEEIQNYSAEWKNWEAYSAFYLWRSLYD